MHIKSIVFCIIRLNYWNHSIIIAYSKNLTVCVVLADIQQQSCVCNSFQLNISVNPSLVKTQICGPFFIDQYSCFPLDIAPIILNISLIKVKHVQKKRIAYIIAFGGIDIYMSTLLAKTQIMESLIFVTGSNSLLYFN